MPSAEHIQELEVAIIGGGPAGQSAALVAGRARLRTVLFNAGPARNFVTGASHGFVTRDGVHPSAFREVALEQLEKYPSVEPVEARITEVEREPGEGAFVLGAQDGRKWRAERLVLATGYRDDPDRLGWEGFDEVYGRSVFPCPFCDGFEHADEKLAVFMGEGAEHFVKVVSVWSEDVVVFTDGHELTAEVRADLEKHGVPVEQAAIRGLRSTEGKLNAVELIDGRILEREAGFIGLDFSAPATDFAERLGVGQTTNPWGMSVLDADDEGRTSVPGLFVVGDAKTGFGGLIASAAEGSACASAIVHDVAGRRWAGRASS